MESISFFHTDVFSLILLWHSNVEICFWVPWTLLYKEQCITGNYVMCVIAQNERSAGCASLCPLILIMPLCLTAWVIFASFDKRTMVCFCVWPHISSDELDVWLHCWADTHPYVSEAWWASDITINNLNINISLNRNVISNKKFKKKKNRII